jgi:hypothetical protein
LRIWNVTRQRGHDPRVFALEFAESLRFALQFDCESADFAVGIHTGHSAKSQKFNKNPSVNSRRFDKYSMKN